MMLEGIVLLSGYTERAKAYVQGMAAAELVPSLSVLYGRQAAGKLGQNSGLVASCSFESEVSLPNLSETLDETIAANQWPSISLEADNVNDPTIATYIRLLGPKLIIFSGYGGELVREGLLDIAPILHVHSGWLPDFRGSTTAYYSWLARDSLGASAILLNKGIDTGSILMRREYSRPPAGVDVDFVWDPAIRADLLVRVLAFYRACGALPPPLTEQPDAGKLYYVIHPVLKHIALLSHREQIVQLSKS